MANTLIIPYPDTLPSALRMTQEEFELEARLILATRLYEEKKITSGQAAEMTGLSRVAFLQKTASMKLAAAMPPAEDIAEDAGE